MSELKYNRILLKVSGEALGEKTAQGDGFGLNFPKIHEVCESIKACLDMGVQVGLVIGGGNFWRGVKNGSGKLQRSHADAMGMLATVMNAMQLAMCYLSTAWMHVYLRQWKCISLPSILQEIWLTVI